MSYLKKSLLIGVILFFSASLPASPDDASFYKEVNLITGYSHNDKLIGKDGRSLKNSLGFEYYRKFSNDRGDYLTADLQMRFSYDSLENSNNAFAVEIHNAWLEYKLGLGKALRFGHFAPSFGLEPVVDTHGTLFQTLALKNIGFKKDWGLGYRGFWGLFDYELSAQAGSGMTIAGKDDNFLLTTRISRGRGDNLQYGLSFLYGQTLQPRETKTIPQADFTSEKTILKKRIGLDAQYLSGPYTFKGEVAYGQNDDNEVLGLLLETDYTLPKLEALEFQLQTQLMSRDLESSQKQDLMLALGAAYKFSPTVTMRLGYFHDIYVQGKDKDRQVVLQLYYYGS